MRGKERRGRGRTNRRKDVKANEHVNYVLQLHSQLGRARWLENLTADHKVAGSNLPWTVCFGYKRQLNKHMAL